MGGGGHGNSLSASHPRTDQLEPPTTVSPQAPACVLESHSVHKPGNIMHRKEHLEVRSKQGNKVRHVYIIKKTNLQSLNIAGKYF